MKKRVKITGYKVVTWVDQERAYQLYGAAVLVVGTGWAYLETNRRPEVHWHRSGAEKAIGDMKKRRTRAGYKRKRGACR